MKIYTSLAIGAALIAASTVASADQLTSGMQTPLQLTDQQMETVTAAGRKGYGHGCGCKWRWGTGVAVADAGADAYGGHTNATAAFAYTYATPHSASSVASSAAYAGP